MRSYLSASILRALLIVFFMGILTPMTVVANDLGQHHSSLKKTMNKLRLGGLIEVSAFDDDNEDYGDSSQIELATIELALEADINNYTRARLHLLWEENNTEPTEIDEATITFASLHKVELTAGKTYLPFGVFHSHFITDPQTHELGEIREHALLLKYRATYFLFSAAIYDGEIDEHGDSNEINYVASIIVTPHEWLEFGLSYNSDLADSDIELTHAHRLDSSLEETVSGAGAFINLTHKNWGLNLEYIGANKGFNATDLDADGDGKGDRPRAYNIELAYAASERLNIAARLEGNKDFFDRPERQYGACVTLALFKNVSASLEYMHGEYDAGAERKIVSAQLAIKF